LPARHESAVRSRADRLSAGGQPDDVPPLSDEAWLEFGPGADLHTGGRAATGLPGRQVVFLHCRAGVEIAITDGGLCGDPDASNHGRRSALTRRSKSGRSFALLMTEVINARCHTIAVNGP
jgi:hypothetical protein